MEILKRLQTGKHDRQYAFKAGNIQGLHERLNLKISSISFGLKSILNCIRVSPL